ncbi:MAG: hypothetical protein Q4G65_12735 [bacterium]|nr:hypothetical protein [bacterium]
MKMTLNMPSELLEAAMATGHGSTKTATIIYALEQLVRLSKLAKLRAMRGTLPDFGPDLDITRGRA